MATQAAEGERTSLETFNLEVVSPSVGVNGPLSFPDLATTTTVKQLKERIREAIPAKPNDERQRLIHRGRMLARADETMADIFGLETLRNSDKHVLHLVLKEDPSIIPPPQTSQVATIHQDTPQLPRPHVQIGPFRIPALPTLQGVGNTPLINTINPNTSHAAALAESSQRIRMLEQERIRIQGIVARQHQNGQQHVPPIQLPRHLFATNQHGMPEFGAPPTRSTTYTREGVNPDGGRYQVTVNETTIVTQVSHNNQGNPSQITLTPIPGETQNALERPGVPQGQQAASDSQSQGSSSSENTTASQSVPTSASATGPDVPDISGIFASNPTASQPPQVPHTGSSASGASPVPTTVYILSSPEGPRALLLTDSGTYYSPRNAPSYNINTALSRQQRHEERALRRAARHEAARQNNPNPADAPFAPAGHALPRPHPHPQVPAQAHVHPGNPAAGALVLLVWPHIWLIVRLLMFIWFFTSNNNSWWRWISICSLAFVVFLVNVGFFGWAPVRRWVNMVNLVGPRGGGGGRGVVVLAGQGGGDGGQAQGQGQAQAQAAEGVQGAEAQAHADGNRAPPLDPAATAERLLAAQRERQNQNQNWLWNQARRVEHALLLFFASLVPGVGERHVAAREAEVEAERRRMREVEEAVAAAAAAAAAAANEGAGEARAEGAGVEIEGHTSGVDAHATGNEADGEGEMRHRPGHENHTHGADEQLVNI